MKVVIIGSGNLATNLSLALSHAGVEIVQVYSPTIEHSRQLADKLSCSAASSVHDICIDADAYIISIKDDAIASIVSLLKEGREKAVFLHTAGSVPMSVFEGKVDSYGVLYPMQTFSKNRIVDFASIPCFIEASDDRSLEVIRFLAEKISDNVITLSSDKRKLLHLSAVFACNLTNHCYRLAELTMTEAGLDFSLLLPLINETARKVSTMSPHDAQTGPMVRYDKNIMQNQLQLINDELTRNIYKLMAESIHRDK